MVQTVGIPAAPASGRPVGGPVAILMWSCLLSLLRQLVEKVLAQVVPPPKARKQYQKWELQHQQMALDIAKEKDSNGVAVSVLRELFPKVYGSLMQSTLDPSAVKQRTANQDAEASRIYQQESRSIHP